MAKLYAPDIDPEKNTEENDNVTREEFESVNDVIKNEAKKIWQTKTGRERAQYFIYYYKVHFIVAVFAIVAIISIVRAFVMRKDSVLEVMVVNGEYSEYLDYQPIIDGFAATQEYDTKKEEMLIDPSNHVDLNTPDQYNQTIIQKIFMNVAAKELDVMMCDEDFMKFTRAQDIGVDLSTVLNDEQMGRYKDLLVWYDFPPEEVGDDEEYIGRNEAVCIDITDFKKVKDNAMFPYSEHAYLFIPVNTQNMERAIAFLEYLDE